MCVSFILYNCLNKYLLVLAFNRDEVLNRDTRSAHWWDDQEGVVGGRDCVGGGTWLCAHVDGKIAFLTNFRKRGKELHRSNTLDSAPSRGVLPINFVINGDHPVDYLSNVDPTLYPGFNLVVADLGNAAENGSQVHYLSNAAVLGDEDAPNGPLPLPPGVHGLSNAVLDTPWPKVNNGRRRFEAMAGSGIFDGEEFPWEAVFGLMKDPTVLETDPRKLPDTGYGPEFESAASAIFMEPLSLDGVSFGTRSVAILAVPRDGSPAELREQYLTNDGGWAEERHRFHMKLADELPKID